VIEYNTISCIFETCQKISAGMNFPRKNEFSCTMLLSFQTISAASFCFFLKFLEIGKI